MRQEQAKRLIDPLVIGFWRLLEWRLSDQQCLSFLKSCIEQGITYTDHADIYGQYQCEAAFGRALSLEPSIREQITLITKCGIRPALRDQTLAGKVNYYDSSKSHIIASAHQSLRHFRTDRLDILLLHRPDYLMDADDVAEAFTALKQRGDVMNFGVSNFSPSQFSLLQSRCDFPLVTNQIECSPFELSALDDGTLSYCQEHRVTPMFWSPLAGGKLFNNDDEKGLRLRQVLQQVGHEIGANSIDQVVYCWLFKFPTLPSIILGTGNIERVKSAALSHSLKMEHEQWYRILQASTGHSVP